jgi:hypothetical protein
MKESKISQIYGYNNSSHIPIEGVPIKNPIYNKEQYNVTTYKDVGFMIVFLLHLLFIIMFGIIGMTENNITIQNYTNNTNNKNNTNKINDELNGNYILTTSLITICLSYLILFAIKQAPETFIYIANIFVIVLNFISAIYYFSNGIIFGGILFLFQGCLLGFWFYVARAYIPFSKLLLKVTINILENNKLVFLVPIISILFASIYTVFMVFCIKYFSVKNGDNYNINGWLIFLFIMLFFWMQQIVSNIIHVTVAGVIGSWYYIEEVAQQCINIVWKSFIRATTTNLGSICFGSLIVAIIQTLRIFVNFIRKSDDNFISCCAECILELLDRMLQYFSMHIHMLGYMVCLMLNLRKQHGNYQKDLFLLLYLMII